MKRYFTIKLEKFEVLLLEKILEIKNTRRLDFLSNIVRSYLKTNYEKMYNQYKLAYDIDSNEEIEKLEEVNKIEKIEEQEIKQTQVVSSPLDSIEEIAKDYNPLDEIDQIDI